MSILLCGRLNYNTSFNRTLLDMLSKTVRDRPFEWEEHIQRLCLAYNTSLHPTTGYSPFFLMFGRQVRMPVDLMYGTPAAQPTSVPEFVGPASHRHMIKFGQPWPLSLHGRRSSMTRRCMVTHSRRGTLCS